MKNEKLLCRSYENTTWGACNPFMMYPHDRQRTRFCASRTPDRQLANQQPDRRGMSSRRSRTCTHHTYARHGQPDRDVCYANINKAMSNTYASPEHQQRYIQHVCNRHQGEPDDGWPSVRIRPPLSRCKPPKNDGEYKA